jgi:hypothetical protein
MVSPMAAMLATIDEKNMDHRAYKLINRWYWSSVFTERYAGAVESLIHKDFSDFIKALMTAIMNQKLSRRPVKT